MNPNSISVYREKVQPTILKRHEKVYYALRSLGIAHVYEIAAKLNVPVHTISGRLTELSGTKNYDRPMIEAVGMKPNQYGNPCTMWKIIERKEAEQKALF